MVKIISCWKKLLFTFFFRQLRNKEAKSTYIQNNKFSYHIKIDIYRDLNAATRFCATLHAFQRISFLTKQQYWNRNPCVACFFEVTFLKESHFAYQVLHSIFSPNLPALPGWKILSFFPSFFFVSAQVLLDRSSFYSYTQI